MFKKQQTLICKIASIVFILLLLTPCTIKADIKLSLNITTSTINKDRVSVNSCSSFSRSESKTQVSENEVAVQKDSLKLLGRDQITQPCAKTLVLESKKVKEDVNYYTTPIFIHFRELII